jgi:hypothetical protein
VIVGDDVGWNSFDFGMLSSGGSCEHGNGPWDFIGKCAFI